MKHKMATLQEKQLYREFRLSDLQNTEQSSNPSLLDTNFSPKNEEIVAKKQFDFVKEEESEGNAIPEKSLLKPKNKPQKVCSPI